tara:strand:+ start:317 stop:541 length:225 start_codon:yes stop_codon:yes gene_type:complete
MVQFEYDGVMKRYNVKVRMLNLKRSEVTVASISEDKEARITVHRELSVNLMHQILLHWDEYEHQMIRKGEEDGI